MVQSENFHVSHASYGVVIVSAAVSSKAMALNKSMPMKLMIESDFVWDRKI